MKALSRLGSRAVAGLVVSASVLFPAGPVGAVGSASGRWALVADDEPTVAAAQQGDSFGGVCVLGQKNRVVGNSYPKNVYFAGGARCTSGGRPVDVFQEGRVTLYRGVREAYLAEGNEIFGLQDWSVSKGNFGGGKGLRFTNNIRLRLTTPDGKPWAIVPGECDRETPSTVQCDVDKSGRVR